MVGFRGPVPLASLAGCWFGAGPHLIRPPGGPPTTSSSTRSSSRCLCGYCNARIATAGSPGGRCRRACGERCGQYENSQSGTTRRNPGKSRPARRITRSCRWRVRATGPGRCGPECPFGVSPTIPLGQVLYPTGSGSTPPPAVICQCPPIGGSIVPPLSPWWRNRRRGLKRCRPRCSLARIIRSNRATGFCVG